MIEKKRRDRINASLGELRRLVPAAARDPHSGKLEKAEILQLTVEHLRTLRNKGEFHTPSSSDYFLTIFLNIMCVANTAFKNLLVSIMSYTSYIISNIIFSARVIFWKILI